MTQPPFIPHPREPRSVRNIKIELSPERYEQVSNRAKAAGVSIKEYVRQALDFAMTHEQ